MATIRILLVDDNKDKDSFFEPLADLAFNLLKAELIHVHTFEDMTSIFDESPYDYQAIILDGKGQKNKASKTEDDGFLNISLKWLRSKTQEGIFIPYVIYSGYADELKKVFDDEDIFWKARNEETEMFQKLREKIYDSEYYKHIQICPDIFELFEINLLPSKYKADLIKAAQVYTDTFTGNKEEVLRSLRPMLEATFMKLHELDGRLISPKCFKRGDPNLSSIIWYLSGSPKRNHDTEEIEFQSDIIMPQHLYYITDALKNITSKASMHHYDESSSKYLLKSSVNAFFEYCVWYKNFASKNYLNRNNDHRRS